MVNLVLFSSLFLNKILWIISNSHFLLSSSTGWACVHGTFWYRTSGGHDQLWPRCELLVFMFTGQKCLWGFPFTTLVEILFVNYLSFLFKNLILSGSKNLVKPLPVFVMKLLSHSLFVELEKQHFQTKWVCRLTWKCLLRSCWLITTEFCSRGHWCCTLRSSILQLTLLLFMYLDALWVVLVS